MVPHGVSRVVPHDVPRWCHMAFPEGAIWTYLVSPHGIPRRRHMDLYGLATWLYLVSPHGLVLSHGFTWCLHMAFWCCHMSLPGAVTWLYPILPGVIIFIIHAHACMPCVIHMTPHRIMTMHGDMCPTMCHHYNPYPCMAAMCHTHDTF